MIFSKRFLDVTTPLVLMDTNSNRWGHSNEGEFGVSIHTIDGEFRFEYQSTQEMVDKLSDQYIEHNVTEVDDSVDCPICGFKKHPFSGAEGYKVYRLFGFTVKKEPVNICLSCSSDLRRAIIKEGTPEYSTEELLVRDWGDSSGDGFSL